MTLNVSNYVVTEPGSGLLTTQFRRGDLSGSLIASTRSETNKRGPGIHTRDVLGYMLVGKGWASNFHVNLSTVSSVPKADGMSGVRNKTHAASYLAEGSKMDESRGPNVVVPCLF